MLLKQISLAALAATFITGSAAVANAESNVGVGETSGVSTSRALQGDWASGYGDAGISVIGPSASMNAYGYAGERRLDRSRDRNARMKRNTY